MRVIKEHDLTIMEQKLETACEITLAVKINDLENIVAVFETIHPVKVSLN
jgi:hypothetical protein